MLKLPVRGQQALEYLITYGWAFVIILLTLGVFSYFGLLNPIHYVPERCDFGVQMLCDDFILRENGDQGYAMFRVRNAYDHSIAIYDVKTADEKGTFKICENDCSGGSEDFKDPQIPVKLLDGAVSNPIILDLSGTDYTLVEGDKISIPIMINFSRCDDSGDSCSPPPNGPYHIVYGEIFAKVQKP